MAIDVRERAKPTIEAHSNEGNEEYPNKRARFEDEDHVTLATISEASKHCPFQIRSTLKGCKVITLVDSGASHNFINEKIVKQRKLETLNFKGFEVATATRAKVWCTKIVTQLEILLGQHPIKEDFYVVHLDSDCILGTLCIYSLRCFMFDLPNLTIHFQHNGKEITLRGLPNGSPKVISCKRMERIFKCEQGKWATQCMILDKSTTQDKAIHINIQPITKKYRKVFEEIPLGLPPKRGFEHTIELEEGAKPIITTPYRHPHEFKEEIEKIIKELLEMGHIQPSSSPFASSMVLVKKKDGNLRMCIDYRALNKKTIKNCYPIPELMNFSEQGSFPKSIYSPVITI
jgi:hypothetical protein